MPQLYLWPLAAWALQTTTSDGQEVVTFAKERLLTPLSPAVVGSHIVWDAGVPKTPQKLNTTQVRAALRCAVPCWVCCAQCDVLGALRWAMMWIAVLSDRLSALL